MRLEDLSESGSVPTQPLALVASIRFVFSEYCAHDLLASNQSMPDDHPSRFLCRLSSSGLIVYTCGRCLWDFRLERDDSAAAQVAFDAHRCEDFPPFVPAPRRH